jgi:hypothetical protein
MVLCVRERAAAAGDGRRLSVPPAHLATTEREDAL